MRGGSSFTVPWGIRFLCTRLSLATSAHSWWWLSPHRIREPDPHPCHRTWSRGAWIRSGARPGLAVAPKLAQRLPPLGHRPPQPRWRATGPELWSCWRPFLTRPSVPPCPAWALARRCRHRRCRHLPQAYSSFFCWRARVLGSSCGTAA